MAVRTINGGEKRDYQRSHMQSRRKEIIGIKYVPKEREKQIDVGLYDALSEFDEKYGTEFAKKYFEITIEQIPYTGLSEKNRDRKIRANINKMAMFVEARMNINYNVNIFNMSKNLNIFDRFQAIRVALAQKVNGIQVNLSKPKKSQNILPEYTETTLPEELEIAEILESMREERVKIKDTADELSSQILDASQEEDEKIVEEASTQIPDAPQEEVSTQIPNIPLEENEVINPEVITSTVNEEPEIEAETQPEPEPKPTYESTPKKAMSRSKSIQASKKAAREAGKMKNRYKSKVETKKQSSLSEEEKRKLAQQRRIAKAQKAAEEARIAREQAAEAKRLKAEQEKAEQERIAREEQAKKDAKLSSRVKRIVLGKKTEEGQEEHIVKRFTRKLKDQRDAIRNKVHIPNMSGTKRRIAGAVGAVVIVAALGIGLTSLSSNGSNIENTQPAIESTYQVDTGTEKQDELQAMPEQKDYTEAIQNAIRDEETTHATTGSSVEQGTTQQEIVETVTPETETPTESDSSIDYLSSVRVGARMNIESGKYFECPDGTGNYGYFENNQDGAKEITIIGVSTYEGYFAVTDPDVSLYELKQQYPDAKFSYHFVCKYEDGTTKTLGWLTENSMEQNIDNTRTQSAGEER